MPREKKKFDPPEPSTGDRVFLLANSVLSLIPGATELFQYFLSPPLERRRELWMKEIGDTLRYLDQNQGIKLEDLQSNELFITILTQASNSAIRTHQKEKLEYFRAAIMNTAFKIDISDDLKILFIRYIDELTVSHIVLLNFLFKNEIEISETNSYEKLFRKYIIHNLPVLERDEFKLLCQDLVSRNLIRISSSVDDFAGIHEITILTSESTSLEPKIKVTSVGRAFMEFINNKLP